MDNKYVLMVAAAIVAALWFYVGEMAFFAGPDGMHEDWWFISIIAVGMGAGSTGGKDVISILTEGITGYVSSLIKLVVLAVVGSQFYGIVLNGGAFDVDNLIKVVSITVAASLLTNILVSYLRKAD
ncbi:MAG: hypothetical protein ACKVIX_07850 [Sphingomonadales bacterium]|jgi:hypothetical protein